MTTNRRALLKGAAFSGAVAGVAGLGACARDGTAPGGADEEVSSKITLRTIAEAEKLQGIAFTPEERAQMLEGLENNLAALAALRVQTMPNDLAPALTFSPKLPTKKIKSQKNTLVIGGDYSAPIPDDESDIAFASVAQQSAWLRAGAITSAALTDLYLARIDRLDGKLNAYITVTPEIAREQAAKADAD
ncbi:MAG: amidase, partial [Pseudomonadota bacterium]